MTDFVVITLRRPNTKPSNDGKKKPWITADLAVPVDMPQYLIIDRLIELYRIQKPDKQQGVFVVEQGRLRRKMSRYDSLRKCGIQHGQQLFLEFAEITAKASINCIPGPEFLIEKDVNTIGCSRGVDIDLRSLPNQQYVSGEHAEISFDHGKFYLRDINSKNGTLHNGKKIISKEESIPLKSGDIIIFGGNKQQGIKVEFTQF